MGIWDVEGLKKRITFDQLKKWMAFYKIDPWGSDWRRSGRAALVAAKAAGAKVESDAEERFLPTYREPEQTLEQMKNELRKIPQFREQIDARGD
jgi:hypothetical protein